MWACVVLCQCLLVSSNLANPDVVRSPFIFSPIQDALQAADVVLREMESKDRNEVDKAAANLASKVLKMEKSFEDSKRQYIEVKGEMRYLQGKSLTAKDSLFNAFEQALSEIKLEQNLLDDDCDAMTNLLESVQKYQLKRADIVDQIIALLDDNILMTKLRKDKQAASVAAVAVLNLVQEAMDSTSSANFYHPDLPEPLPKNLEEAVSMLRELRAIMGDSPKIREQRATLKQNCLFGSSKLALRLSETEDGSRNATQSQRDWELQADEKERQLRASDPVLAGKQRTIDEVRGELTKVANAYQDRRNLRLSMLCHTVTARRLVAHDEHDQSITDATLPGPAQYDHASLHGLMQCPGNFHPVAVAPLPSPAGPTPSPSPRNHVLKPCPRPPLVSDGETLPDHWADKISEEPCLPIDSRLVDVDETPALL